jgi:hypothetical protein
MRRRLIHPPLHIATRRGDASSVELLLNANTDRSARTRDGQTALDIARAKGYENIYARLMEKRTGITRTAAATQQADAASALINNVRNELPALQISRTPTGNSSIVGELRQLRNFDRLVNVAGADDGAAVGIPAGTVVPSSSSRRQRQESGGLVSASLDLSNAEQQGREVQRKSESERRAVDTARALGGSLHGGINSVAAAESLSKAESSRSRNTAAVSSYSTSRGADASAGGHTASRVAQAAHGADARAGYAIMGASHDGQGNGAGNMRGAAPGDETAVIALRKILDQEIATRKTLEIKVSKAPCVCSVYKVLRRMSAFCFVYVQLAVFKDQNTQLLEEFALLSQQLSSAQESYSELEAQMARLLGEPAALEAATIEECEELEGQLKGALQRIDAKKVSLLGGVLRLWEYHLTCLRFYADGVDKEPHWKPE